MFQFFRKKGVIVYFRESNGKLVTLDRCCPRCHRKLPVYASEGKYEYCPSCGQRLDWVHRKEERRI